MHSKRKIRALLRQAAACKLQQRSETSIEVCSRLGRQIAHIQIQLGEYVPGAQGSRGFSAYLPGRNVDSLFVQWITSADPSETLAEIAQIIYAMQS
jgi:hypothetical protein